MYQALDINTFLLASHSVIHPARNGVRSIPIYEKHNEIEKLSNRLSDRVKSDEPSENLDFIIEELILDQKNKVPLDSKPIQAKRLVASLHFVKDENECNYFGYKILSNNFDAIRPNLNGDNLRRIDKILVKYLNEHVKNCKQVYFTKFDSISKSLNREFLKRLDVVFRKSIERIKSERNGAANYAESLYKAMHKIHQALDFKPVDIYEALIEMTKLEGKDLKGLKRKNIEELFDEYIVKPCEYLRDQFGRDVFEPFIFDSKFYDQIESDRADFYETLFKYEMCYGSFKSERQELLLSSVANE